MPIPGEGSPLRPWMFMQEVTRGRSRSGGEHPDRDRRALTVSRPDTGRGFRVRSRVLWLILALVALGGMTTGSVDAVDGFPDDDGRGHQLALDTLAGESGVPATAVVGAGPDMWWVPHVERPADPQTSGGCSIGPVRICPDETTTWEQTTASPGPGPYPHGPARKLPG